VREPGNNLRIVLIGKDIHQLRCIERDKG
jgi:hypothetical protein